VSARGEQKNKARPGRRAGIFAVCLGLALIGFSLIRGLSGSRVIGYFPTPMNGASTKQPTVPATAAPAAPAGGTENTEPVVNEGFLVTPWFTPAADGVTITFSTEVPATVFVYAHAGEEPVSEASYILAHGISVVSPGSGWDSSVLMPIPAGVEYRFDFLVVPVDGAEGGAVFTLLYALPAAAETPAETPADEPSPEEETPPPTPAAPADTPQPAQTAAHGDGETPLPEDGQVSPDA